MREERRENWRSTDKRTWGGEGGYSERGREEGNGVRRGRKFCRKEDMERSLCSDDGKEVRVMRLWSCCCLVALQSALIEQMSTPEEGNRKSPAIPEIIRTVRGCVCVS